jgi:hypothetical protein
MRYRVVMVGDISQRHHCDVVRRSKRLCCDVFHARLFAQKLLAFCSARAKKD